jgi:hypothetical protein
MPLRPQILFQSPAAESALLANGLGTLDAIFERAAAAKARHVGRAVWKTNLRTADGKRLTAFVKLSWGRRRWWPRLSDIRTGQVFTSLAMREWQGLATFERLGLRVPERLALLEKGLLWKRSALIIKSVPPPTSLSDMILDGSWMNLALDDRRSVLEEVVRTLCRIHAAGWAWRSISTRHVFPQRDAQGAWKLWLIDCEGVHRARSPQILHRDVRRLLRALAHDQVDPQTLEIMRAIGGRLSAFRGWDTGQSRFGGSEAAA